MTEPISNPHDSPNKGSQHLEKKLDFLAPGWSTLLGPFFASPAMDRIRDFLRTEYRSGYTVYPPKDSIFAALKTVDPVDVRVVILGQDPYHGPGQANGLAFAVGAQVGVPPSLRNIFLEVGKNPLQADRTLHSWASQGVLLLNTVLTVRAGEPASHKGQGWEEFTDTVIQELNKLKHPIAFLLWGSQAAAKQPMVTSSHHLVLKAPHPSPLSAHRGFLGCGHFLKTNEFLKKHYGPLGVINW